MIDVDCGLKIEEAVKRLKRDNLNFALITVRRQMIWDIIS